MSKQTDLINIPDAITVSGSNVGIGTSSPTAVSGTTALEITGTSGSEVIIGTSDTTATGNDLFGGLAFKSLDTNGTAPHYSGIKARAADTYGGANLEFYAGRSNYESNDPRFIIEGPQSVSGEAMRIDSSGRVTMPYQPAFSAYGNNQSVLVNTDVDATLPNEEFDAGNNYDTSTSRFTAPVSGRYLFTGTVQYNGIGQSHIVFRVNNSFVNNGWTNGGSTESATQSRILNLAAGDYVNMRLYSNQAGATNGQRTRMTGCLLG